MRYNFWLLHSHQFFVGKLFQDSQLTLLRSPDRRPQGVRGGCLVGVGRRLAYLYLLEYGCSRIFGASAATVQLGTVWVLARSSEGVPVRASAEREGIFCLSLSTAAALVCPIS